MGFICFVQEPTPITAMELSTKQVKTCFLTLQLIQKLLTRVKVHVKQKSEKFSVFKHTLLPISKECAHWELNPQAPSFLQEPFQLRRTGTFNFYILALSLTPTATAVPWLSPGCITDVFTPLRSVWESLRWVLPGQRPLLRLGRCWVLEILSYCQEVGAGNR